MSMDTEDAFERGFVAGWEARAKQVVADAERAHRSLLERKSQLDQQMAAQRAQSTVSAPSLQTAADYERAKRHVAVELQEQQAHSAKAWTTTWCKRCMQDRYGPCHLAEGCDLGAKG